VVEFGEWLCGNVVKAVPHRHVVFAIPKILRRYFLYNRKLLSALSRCAWEAVSGYLQAAASSERLRPAAVNAIQTFGDFLEYNPHCHMLVADVVFHESGAFTVAPEPDGKQTAELFRHKVLKMLLAKGKITPERIALMDNWRHTGFNVFVGPRILPW
jgi:hypothetical protein